MAKQIKVLKCPQCGNTKPVAIDKDHYRCDKCNTEFFLDNDDITVNVNHRIEQDNTPTVHRKVPIYKYLFSILFLVFVFFGFAVKKCTDEVNTRPANTVSENPYKKYDNIYRFSTIFYAQGKPVAFYIESRRKEFFAVFRDIYTGEVLKEEMLRSMESTGRNRIDYRYFLSNNTNYLVIGNRLIFVINPNDYSFRDVTNEIEKTKPALNEGFSAVYFVSEEQGEGFKLITNLGKEFYYFPAPDMLYTEKAFEHVAEGKAGTLPEAEEKTYYLLLNKDSNHSSNVTQVIEVKYLFNNGGPENKLTKASQYALKHPGRYRILSSEPITGDMICFAPKILYSDNESILIMYRATLADDAVTNIQLLNTAGELKWTVPFTEKIESKHTIRTGNGYLLQLADGMFYEISSDGKTRNEYTFGK